MTEESKKKILSKIVKTDSCWIWGGYIGVYGYGKIHVEGKHRRAHRAVYEALVGKIPEGLVLDHLCEVKSCVNPEHLEPVTPRENTLRCTKSPAYLNSIKTHCKYGHEFTVANTLLKKSNGKRACKSCKRLKPQEYNVDKKLELVS